MDKPAPAAGGQRLFHPDCSAPTMFTKGDMSVKITKIFGIGLAAAIGIGLLYIAPLPAGISSAGWASLAVLLMMLTLWITDAIPGGTSAFLGLILLTLTEATSWGGKVTAKTKIINALSGFSQSETWLVLAAFVLGVALVESGLGLRITYRIMSFNFIGKSFRRVMLGLVGAMTVIAPFIPSSTAKAGIFVPLSQGVLDTLGIKPQAETGVRSNCATAMMINNGWMTNTTGLAFATGSAGTVTGIGILATVSHVTVSWFDYLLAMFLPTMIVVVFAWWMLLKLFPPEFTAMPGGGEEARQRYNDLGPMKPVEKRVLAIFGFTLVMWILEKQIQVDTATTAIISCFLLMAPVVGLGMKDKDILRKVSWSGVILFGTSMSLAKAFSSTGAAKWLAQIVFGNLQMASWSPLAIVAFFSGFMFITHLLFASGTAHKVTFMPLILAYTTTLGINPIWIGLPVIISSGNAFMLHTMTPPNIIAYGTGHFRLPDFIKSGTLLTIFAWLIYVAAAMVWFPLIGIPVRL